MHPNEKPDPNSYLSQNLGAADAHNRAMNGRGRSQMEVWRLIIKPRLVCRLPVVVADLHRFDEGLDPDMHQNETSELDPHQSETGIPLMWIRIKVKTGVTLMLIRKTKLDKCSAIFHVFWYICTVPKIPTGTFDK